MKKEIKAFIFDIGGVLWLGKSTQLRYHHSGVHQLVAKKLGISVDQYFDAIDTTYAKAILGEIGEQKALRIMARNLKTTPGNLRKLYVGGYERYFTLNDELLKKAKELDKIGYRVAILSDQWGVSRDALVIERFYRIFNPVLISCEIGMRKPEVKSYRLILKKLKMKPHEVVFIDNQKWNITPAKKLGLHTILFKNNRQTLKDIEKFIK